MVDSTPAGEYLLSIFSEAWNFSQFGLEKFEDLLDVIRDTVSMGEQDFMKAAMQQDSGCGSVLDLGLKKDVEVSVLENGGTLWWTNIAMENHHF